MSREVSNPGRFARRSLLTGGAALGVGSVAAIGGVVGSRNRDDSSDPTPMLVGSALAHHIDVTAAPFEAAADGVADDTDAIAAAYRAAESSRQPLFFPPGTYRVSSLPSFADYTTIAGAGADLTTLLYEGDDTLLTLDAQRVSFEKLGFWVTGPSGTIIELSNCFRCSFDTVVFRGEFGTTTSTTHLEQTGVVLSDNSGGTSFVNCDFNNLGRGLVTSAIQNYITQSKFATNNIGVLGTGNNFAAGLAITNSEFVSDPVFAAQHIRIDGASNDWWLTNVWFEGAQTGVLVGEAGVGGPSQFGMTNCKISATQVVIDIQHCRQAYLANVITDADPGFTPIPLRIAPATAPEGTAINLINGLEPDFPLSVFPPGWHVLGRGRATLADGPVVTSPNGRRWRIEVGDTGALTTTALEGE